MTCTLAAGCGASTGLDARDAAADVTTVTDAAHPVDATHVKNMPPAEPSPCEVLTLAFVGCDDARRAECDRELAAVDAATRVLLLADLRCLRDHFAAVSALSWPGPGSACSTTTTPRALDPAQQWFHGTCQSQNGALAGAVRASGIPCGGEDLPMCFFGPANGGATL